MIEKWDLIDNCGNYLSYAGTLANSNQQSRKSFRCNENCFNEDPGRVNT